MILYIYGDGFWSNKRPLGYTEVYEVELPKEIEKAYDENYLYVVDRYAEKYLKNLIVG